ncbi:unnamed protein product [Coffea canephora]|uniref:DH200=94 genomic scaffold, scaffold_205 n=1 Tax=Coffea canephora TaxID=49390 RepID=A0A068VBV8_COFCA|nr:unnamed protein product [Coffea canephora]
MVERHSNIQLVVESFPFETPHILYLFGQNHWQRFFSNFFWPSLVHFSFSSVNLSSSSYKYF